MGSIEHGHAVEVHAFLTQFEDALGDKGRLFAAVIAGDERRLRAGFAGRRELLGKLVDVRRNGGIGEVENLRCAASCRDRA
jgi:hypothetical protein